MQFCLYTKKLTQLEVGRRARKRRRRRRSGERGEKTRVPLKICDVEVYEYKKSKFWSGWIWPQLGRPEKEASLRGSWCLSGPNCPPDFMRAPAPRMNFQAIWVKFPLELFWDQVGPKASQRFLLRQSGRGGRRGKRKFDAIGYYNSLVRALDNFRDGISYAPNSGTDAEI